jgi:hypothetical protein
MPESKNELNQVLDLIAEGFEYIKASHKMYPKQQQAYDLYREKFYALFAAAPELLKCLQVLLPSLKAASEGRLSDSRAMRNAWYQEYKHAEKIIAAANRKG